MDQRTRVRYNTFGRHTDIVYRIDYTKKKEKKDAVKFVKDENALTDDNYKSHTVHVRSGEPPNSQSFPPAKRKEGVVRPITQGKLLKRGGPDVSLVQTKT